MTQIDVALTGTARAAGQARDAVRSLKALLKPETFEDLRLLVSEVVANSVRHAGALDHDNSVRLKVNASETVVRVEVSDKGPGFDKSVLREPSPDDPSGRGLFLVDKLAESWGVIHNDETRVWFVLVS